MLRIDRFADPCRGPGGRTADATGTPTSGPRVPPRPCPGPADRATPAAGHGSVRYRANGAPPGRGTQARRPAVRKRRAGRAAVLTRVYLDQWVWIRLAGAALGRPKDPQDADVLAMVRELVRLGLASYPLSPVHYKELAAGASPRQGHELAPVIAEISRHHTMIGPGNDVLSGELDRYLLPGASACARPPGQCRCSARASGTRSATVTGSARAWWQTTAGRLAGAGRAPPARGAGRGGDRVLHAGLGRARRCRRPRV